MVLPNERERETQTPWYSGATLAGAIVALGLLAGGPLEQAQTAAPDKPQTAAAPCTGGDEVSNFVCRNRWLADLEHNHR
jgi:hypothetical protein